MMNVTNKKMVNTINGYYAIFDNKGKKIKDNIKLNTRSKQYEVNEDSKLHIYYMQMMKKEVLN